MRIALTLPLTVPGNFHVYNQFTVRAPKRDALRSFLKEKGVGTEVYYPLPMHLQNCYRDLGTSEGVLPCVRTGGRRGDVHPDLCRIDRSRSRATSLR